MSSKKKSKSRRPKRVRVADDDEDDKKSSSSSPREDQKEMVFMQIGPDPVPMTCPYCKKDVVTVVEKYAGIMTYLMCLAFCCICASFCCDCTKDAKHTCPKCGQIVGRYTHC